MDLTPEQELFATKCGALLSDPLLGRPIADDYSGISTVAKNIVATYEDLYEKYTKSGNPISRDEHLYSFLYNQLYLIISDLSYSEKSENIDYRLKVLETVVSKNIDYGNSFDRNIEQFGMVAAFIRISDKSNRLDNLLKSDHTYVDESLLDTALDIAGYLTLTLIYLADNDMK